MFDTALGELQRAATAVAGCDPALLDADERAAAIKALRATADVLAGAEAGLLNTFDARGDYREHGSPTTAAWARRELRMTGEEARTRVAAARALAQLPVFGRAARTGQIRFEHAKCLTAGITKCGLDTVVDAQEWLLPVTQHCDPKELGRLLDDLAEVLHPDELDEAWVKGMDKQDVKLAKTSQGYHLTGFLDIVSGARFKAWLDAAAAPRDADDHRTASQRRTDALGELFESALAHGMPTDRGVRPQLNIDCDLETLLAMFAAEAHAQTGPKTQADVGAQPGAGADTDVGGSAGGDTDADASRTRAARPYAARPAELSGFGPIGPDLGAPPGAPRWGTVLPDLHRRLHRPDHRRTDHRAHPTDPRARRRPDPTPGHP